MKSDWREHLEGEFQAARATSRTRPTGWTAMVGPSKADNEDERRRGKTAVPMKR
jgi:2-oxoglutarate dehydrogenase E1 component